jgi:hypothetical protein
MHAFLRLFFLSKLLFERVRSETILFSNLLPGDTVIKELNPTQPIEERIYDVEESERQGVELVSEPAWTFCNLLQPIEKIVAYYTEDDDQATCIGLDSQRQPSLYRIPGPGKDPELLEKIATATNSSFLFAKLYRDYENKVAFRVYYVTQDKQLMYLDSSIARDVDNPSEFTLNEQKDYRVAKIVHLSNYSLIHIQSKGSGKFESTRSPLAKSTSPSTSSFSLGSATT